MTLRFYAFTYAALFLSGRKLPSEAMDQFGTYWIEAGHHIRDQIGDDRIPEFVNDSLSGLTL